MKEENVLCIPVENLHSTFDLSQSFWSVDLNVFNALPFLYKPRTNAECDFTLKQLIPYAVICRPDGAVLTYQRKGSEKRLSDKWSVGIGGHVNDGDQGSSLYDTLINGLLREFEEEVGIKLSATQFVLQGMINEDITEVGHCHTGVVFSVLLTDTSFSFEEVLGSPTWQRPEEVNASLFELWSGLALELIHSKG